MSESKKLYRSQTNKVFGGVCGGIAEYLEKDAVLIRLLWVLLTLLGGSGLFLYIIALFVIPTSPHQNPQNISQGSVDFSAAKIFGTLFILVGVIILMDNLDILSFCQIRHLFWEYGLPLFLILLGAFFLIIRTKRSDNVTASAPHASSDSQQTDTQSATPSTSAVAGKKELHRSETDKKFLGICGGFAEYFDIDSSIVRIAYAIFTVFSSGAGIIIYFVLYLVLPEPVKK